MIVKKKSGRYPMDRSLPGTSHTTDLHGLAHTHPAAAHTEHSSMLTKRKAREHDSQKKKQLQYPSFAALRSTVDTAQYIPLFQQKIILLGVDEPERTFCVFWAEQTPCIVGKFKPRARFALPRALGPSHGARRALGTVQRARYQGRSLPRAVVAGCSSGSVGIGAGPARVAEGLVYDIVVFPRRAVPAGEVFGVVLIVPRPKSARAVVQLTPHPADHAFAREHPDTFRAPARQKKA
jgi:hypothetical protein